MNTSVQRACTTVGAVAVLGLLTAGSASAHVSATSPDATQGGYTVVTFRVPNESATAATTGVTVTLPTEDPLTSVRTTPMPGWTATIDKDPGTDLVTTVTWTADAGTSIGVDQFGEFELSVGPLPDTESVTFDAAQTYNDGAVVDWNEAPNADGSEPEHPAPVLALAASTGDAHGGGQDAATATEAGNDQAAGEVAAASSSIDGTARWLGGGGVLLGALGLGVGAGAVVRSRRGSNPS